jgi:formylglycine-generating enzyme required for sulfatase activity
MTRRTLLSGMATAIATIARPAVAPGVWSDDGWPCRSAFRVRFEPERRYHHIGFRVVVVELR